MKKILLNPIKNIFGSIRLPGSKSIANRILIIASQAIGKTKIYNIPINRDFFSMLISLRKLGVFCKLKKKKKYCEILGNNGVFRKKNISINTDNSGTTMRFLSSSLSVDCKNITITGKKQILSRPIGDLVRSLLQGGAKIKYLRKNKYPPIIVNGGLKGGLIKVNCTISSQFLSGILMIAPQLKKDTKILVEGSICSKSYIDMTLSIMQQFGVQVENRSYKVFFIKGNQKYISKGRYFIESDVVSASYFAVAALYSGRKMVVKGIGKKTIQGEIKFFYLLKKMGANLKIKKSRIICRKSFLNFSRNINAINIPDSSMTLLISSILFNQNIKIKGLYSWNFKETNRILVFKKELRKIGVNSKVSKNCIKIIKIEEKNKKFITIDTHGDHRIAMCFSLLCCKGYLIELLNSSCVDKSFPDFYKFFLHLSNF
ncbi:3-phosphoshikimate 1-carboxyvinyltransferase [bacterium endosymbiont of Pedicinus badii]|uniref:3-phosphoshikimate 1-carboxyvinyltransferase n=1 Tax=bacterium endosymbiont of Pedicinus badii TaxID=1719126 RepID=UPI0009BBCE35|nr:3-phosphoshikimate 1-carboxyvinyltransferase [bacterium endosymbiont of Pedicinus badii]OQM34345.1 hypothetical protein AOQ89_00400 [bacterium endosymbiont of Pedicinus badii]